MLLHMKNIYYLCIEFFDTTHAGKPSGKQRAKYLNQDCSSAQPEAEAAEAESRKRSAVILPIIAKRGKPEARKTPSGSAAKRGSIWKDSKIFDCLKCTAIRFVLLA